MSAKNNHYQLPTPDMAGAADFVSETLGVREFSLAEFPTEGFNSHVYACGAGGAEYILRQTRDQTGVAKDGYIDETYGRTGLLPVPHVVATSKPHDTSVFCLAERMPGAPADEHEFGERGSLVNESFSELLRRVHTTDVSMSRGYSIAKANGNGMLSKRLHEKQLVYEPVVRYWSALARAAGGIDRKTFKEVRAVHRALGGFAFQVSERRLCHGDLKHDNVLVEDGQVTGLIDWSRFAYMDPAYDLGILKARYEGAIDNQAHAEAVGISTRHLDKRVLYYAIGECFVAMGFLGQRGGQTEKVSWFKNRLFELIAEAKMLEPQPS